MSGHKWVFTIPIGNISREEAEKSIKDLMYKYHTDFKWNPTAYIAEEKRKVRKKKLDIIFNDK